MAVLKGLDIIRRWVVKTFLKEKEQTGVMVNLPKKDFVDLNTSITAERLMRNGIDPNSIKSVDQVENIINQLNKPKVISQGDPEFKGIMDKMMGSNVIKRDFGKPFKEEIKKMETEADIAQRITKDNQKGIANIRKKQKMLADAIDDASPGFANDIKVDAELVAENLAERMGLVYDDLPTKQRLDLYDEAYTGLSKQRFKNMPKPEPEDKADGGRIGFKKGMSRRTFLGLMGAGAAGIGAAKTGLLKLLGKGKATAKIAEVTTPSVAGKPSWFDALANRVIAEGDDVTKRFATKEREIVHVKALDDETTVYVYRDLDDGSVRIDIDDPFRNVQGDQGDALVSLEYKPGIADEGTKGKPPDTFQAVENDYANYMDGPDDYVTEVTDNTVTNTKDLTADLTKVKLYAKGQKKPTLKEFVESRKRKETLKQAEENPSQYAADRQIDYNPDPEDYMDDMASGGLAGLLGE